MEKREVGGNAFERGALRHDFAVVYLERGHDVERSADGTVAGVLVECLGDLALNILPDASAQAVLVVKDIRCV